MSENENANGHESRSRSTDRNEAGRGGPSFWSERPVLVTGATGMIGSWLVKELLRLGARVAAFVKDTDPHSELYRSGDVDSLTVVNGTLEDFWAVERAVNLHEIDCVVHLGAQSIVGVAHRFPLPTFEANIRGTYNLLEACRLHGGLVRRIVVASSDKAYGRHDDLPYTEDAPLAGRHPYEASKSCADILAQTYHHTYDLPVTVARCGNVYGGGDLNWSRIVPGTIRSFLRGERPLVRSDGTFLRDYIYVEDVAKAYVRLAECVERSGVRGEAFNFSTEAPESVLGIVGRISALLDCGQLEPDVRNHAPGEIPHQYLSAAKARQTLDWSPRFDLDTGLTRTIEWYRSFLGA